MRSTNFQTAGWLRRSGLAAAIVLWAIVSVVPCRETKAHEFEDGFVERSVAVVVRDNVARIEYSIGLNPTTREALIDFWNASDDRSSESTEHSPDADDPSTVSAEEIDFLQIAGDNICRRMSVFVSNETVEPRLISSHQSPRHHVDVTVTMEVTLPADYASVPVAIEVVDSNFFPPATSNELLTEENEGNAGATKPQFPAKSQLEPAPFGGGFRYAFKAKGSTVLSRSNVASILIRAQRKLDADLSPVELRTAFKIEAEVVNIK